MTVTLPPPPAIAAALSRPHPGVIRFWIPIEATPDHRGHPVGYIGGDGKAHGRHQPDSKYDAWRERFATLVNESEARKAMTGPIGDAFLSVIRVAVRPESRRCKHVRACSCPYKGLDDAFIFDPSPGDLDNRTLKGIMDTLSVPPTFGVPRKCPPAKMAAKLRQLDKRRRDAEKRSARVLLNDCRVVMARVVKLWGPVGCEEGYLVEIRPIDPVAVLDLDAYLREWEPPVPPVALPRCRYCLRLIEPDDPVHVHGADLYHRECYR